MSIIIRRNGGERGLVPLYHPVSLLDSIDKLAQDMWDSWRPLAYRESLAPSTDIYEEKDDLVVKTELPGIKKGDVGITLEGDMLTIKAEKKEVTTESTTHHARERFYGQYLRSITLPYHIKEDQIIATFENGVLEIRLPKSKEGKAKKIAIKAQLPKGKKKKNVEG